MEGTGLYSLLATEHARLHIIATWPPGAYRDSCVSAVVSIDSLRINESELGFRWVACLKCNHAFARDARCRAMSARPLKVRDERLHNGPSLPSYSTAENICSR